MKFAENNRISHRQLYRQMILGLLAPFLLCIPGRNGMNGLSAVLGIVAAMVFFCFYVIILIRLTPAFDDLVKAAGKVAGRITGVFFLIYILMSGGYLLALLRTLVPASLITGVSGRWIAFWAILVCSVGSRKGMPGRGRMAEVSGGLLSGGILLMMVLCIPQMEGKYLVEMVQRDHLTMENMVRSFYGAVCAFSALGLLPFLMGDVEKYGSAGKTAMWAILTIGGILVGMEFLLPAVLGYDRVRLEKYPVLPLLDGADLPGNVLARFDVIWMGFLLYSLLFSVGSLLHYGHQIVRRAHLGTGRFWMPAMIFLISLLEEEGKGILDYFGWYLGYIFVPGIFICHIYLFLRGKRKHKKKISATVAGVLICSVFLGGCGAAVEPEKRAYPMALGADASSEGFLLTYGMPDMSEATGQEKGETDRDAGVLQISGKNFKQIEQAYNRSQKKMLDMGHLQVLIIGKTLAEDGRWRQILDYLKQEAFVGEDLYVFEAENAAEILQWKGEDNSSVGEYITGLMENRMSGKKKAVVTLRELFYERYKEDRILQLPSVQIRNGSLEVDV